MIDAWIILTLIAASSQTVRSAIQKKLKPVLGDGGASYVRFSYAVPFVWVWIYGYITYTGVELPGVSTGFWFWVSMASMMQAIFTILLITMFSHRSFAAATAFSKTEVLQTAIYEALIIGIVVSFFTGIAIIMGAIAVVVLALSRSNLNKQGVMATLFSRPTAIGLGSGSCLGLTTVFFKSAILQLDNGDVILNASYTCGMAVIIQTIVMGAWLKISKPEQFRLTFIHWKKSMGAGFWGGLATVAWFGAFTLYAVAPVRAVGQVELLISMCVSVFILKEKMTRLEGFSILLLSASIVMVLLA